MRLAGLEQAALGALPMREREVMLAMAQGDDEEQIGPRLGISRNASAAIRYTNMYADCSSDTLSTQEASC